MAEGVTFPSSSHDAGRLPSRLPLFIDTNLDTHLVLDVSPDDMVGHLKGINFLHVCGRLLVQSTVLRFNSKTLTLTLVSYVFFVFFPLLFEQVELG